jgi:hypothetical protein
MVTANVIHFMPGKIVVLLLVVCLLAPAQGTITVDQLVQFIGSAIQRKQDDRQVATYLLKIRLSNKLDDATIEELQSKGAGPKTVAALKNLRDATGSLAPPAAPAPIAERKPLSPPSEATQKKALADAKEYALNYEKNLPNFLCTQVTRRFADPSGKGSWASIDVINENLSYFDHHENYKVLLVNNKPVDTKHEKLSGAVSSGEFGSIMKSIFAPETGTEFEWEGWHTLRGQKMQGYSYQVAQDRSNYHITIREQSKDIVIAYHGVIEVDDQNHFVHRITLIGDGIPPDYPVQDLKITLDYDFENIGDSAYLLPLRFELNSRDERMWVKNDVDYHLYRKFGTESTIKFETPEPVSEDKLKETPVKPDKKQN